MIYPYDLGIRQSTPIVLHKTYAIPDVKKPTRKKYNEYMKTIVDYKNNILRSDWSYELNADGGNYTLYIQSSKDNEGIYFTVRKSS